jgi:hypothetical protein
MEVRLLRLIYNIVDTLFTSSSENGKEEKTMSNRSKKLKLLQLQIEDSQKTALKKRSNKIFNNYLKEVDQTLYKHI